MLAVLLIHNTSYYLRLDLDKQHGGHPWKLPWGTFLLYLWRYNSHSGLEVDEKISWQQENRLCDEPTSIKLNIPNGLELYKLVRMDRLCGMVQRLS